METSITLAVLPRLPYFTPFYLRSISDAFSCFNNVFALILLFHQTSIKFSKKKAKMFAYQKSSEGKWHGSSVKYYTQPELGAKNE